MNLEQLSRVMAERMKEVREFVESDDIKDIIGTEAVGHYKQSFSNEGFTDETLEPWKDVERRDNESPWYGHSGQTGKFSKSRTTAMILHGETSELKNAITYIHTPEGVKVVNDKPYAPVHQFGMKAKIYGKKEFTMPKRPFMGKSKVMVTTIQDKIKRILIRILKR